MERGGIVRTVDDLLTHAGKETRELAARTWAPPLGPSRSARQARWPAFAAAFAVVIVAVGLVPWLAGVGDSGARPSGSISPGATMPTSSPSTGDVVECSASGVPVPGDVAGLPAVVAETRQALIDAASVCDFAALEAIASGGLVTSFGGGGIDNLERWEEEGQGVLGTLLLILLDRKSVV